ncbi:MAG: hypothetical protein GX222_05140 [Ruminococcaceae bacterium]|nr:hypothetical protein [Oscillospiraceae bacterium]
MAQLRCDGGRDKRRTIFNKLPDLSEAQFVLTTEGEIIHTFDCKSMQNMGEFPQSKLRTV